MKKTSNLSESTGTETKSIKTGIFILFVLITSVVKFGFHELWKDEWQAWLVARDMGWSEMFTFLYYEGHPALWYIYLKLWTFVPLDQVLILKFSHLLLVAGVGYLITCKSKFPSIWSLFFLLGYFPAFEYGVVSRGYALLILLFLMLVINQPYWRRAPYLFAVLILLLTQTEVYGIAAAGILLLYLMVHRQIWKDLHSLKSDKQWIFGTIALGLGVVIFWYSMSWAPDSAEIRLRLKTLMDSFEGKSGFANAFQGIWANAMFPGVFRDANTYGPYFLGLSAAAISLLLTFWLFVKDKAALISLVFAGSTVMYFASQIYSGGLRQWGMFFIMFIGLLHLYHEHYPDKSILQVKIHKTKANQLKDLLMVLFLVAICVSQVRYGLIALYKDIRFPFSHSQAAGNYIRENISEQTPIVGISPFNTAAAAAYADRIIYQLPDGEPFTYFKWLEPIYMPPMEELFLFRDYKKSRELIVLTHRILDPKRYPELELVMAFEGYSIKGENYYFYKLKS